MDMIYPGQNTEDNDNDFDACFTVTADAADVGTRLDVYISKVGAASSRNYAQKLIESGNVTVNGKTKSTHYKMHKSDAVCVIIPPPEELSILPENIPIDIVYEDAHLLVINKARGMVVHPAPGNYSGTLVNALLHHCSDLSDINGVIRPGIVHRIDKDTTGLLVAAKTNEAHMKLSDQLKQHAIKRVYIAVVEGILEAQSGTIDMPIGRDPNDRKKMAVVQNGGREAVTHFTVIQRLEGHTLVECRLETGRTHQIRVHMSQIGHPVAGDPLYGRSDTHGMTGQALHARKLTFRHPASGELVSFDAEPPEDFTRLVSGLSHSVSFTI